MLWSRLGTNENRPKKKTNTKKKQKQKQQITTIKQSFIPWENT